MKVLFISHLHPPVESSQNVGGIQTVSVHLLQGLQAHPNLEVCPLLLRSPMQGIARRTLWFLFRLYRTLPQIVVQEQAEVIVFISMVPAALAVLLRQRISIPMVTLNHGLDVVSNSRFDRFWIRRIFKHIDGAIAVSKATQQAALERGLPVHKSTVCPNGITIDRARPYCKAHSRSILEHQFQIDLSDHFLLLSVGRQVKRKGHAWFMQSVFPLVQHKAILLLVGEGKEAQTIAQVKNQSEQGDRIVLAGKLPPELLRHAYDGADLLVMPNIPVSGDMEGFGVVILEANEARTPVIATHLEGMIDVIQPGVNGYTVEPNNPQAFAQTIDATLGQGLSELSESAYQYVIQHYQWQTIIPQYYSFLQQTLKTHSQIPASQNGESQSGLPKG